MADGFKPIRRCDVGGVSLVSADYANQLIDLINALGAATVAPSAGVGSFKLAKGAFILDLNPYNTRLEFVEKRLAPRGGAANFVLTKLSAADFDYDWREASGGGNVVPPCCDDLQGQVDGLESTIEGMQVTITNLQSQITALTNRMDAATIDASCSNGNVTVTLNL